MIKENTKFQKRVDFYIQSNNEEPKRYLMQIRSKDKKDIHIKVKIKSSTNNTSDKEIMELTKEIKKALIRINRLHDKKVSFKIKNCK